MATITEDYVSFECAKLLKEKGFDEPVQYFYKFDSKELYRGTAFTNTQIGDKFYNAPTLQMAMKWLRLTHKIYIQAFAPLYDMDCAELGVTYNVIITNLTDQCLAFDTPLEDIEYNSPEEACEAAIKYCLENLI